MIMSLLRSFVCENATSQTFTPDEKGSFPSDCVLSCFFLSLESFACITGSRLADSFVVFAFTWMLAMAQNFEG